MWPLLAELSTGIAILIVFGVLAVLAAMFFVGIYNRLVGLKNRFKNAFAQIDVQLKRRYDLIPNLVETAKGYIKHERETLEAVTRPAMWPMPPDSRRRPIPATRKPCRDCRRPKRRSPAQ